MTTSAAKRHIDREPTHPGAVLRVGKLAGNGPGLWLQMQLDFDLWHASRALAAELKTIRRAAA